ncbi:glycosyltransferase [Methylomonas koyamae]|uniref:glycosyltransferase n=1 Tax=Methylomonas koyamae TaxID=702114 RepID=UPI002873030B|nr:nucleotide disphospho-sugar-binding domain-containing protein [Methylomonas koyamae]WNB77254.1 glycosyltransferase [Methylomonas koyamae]
MKIVAIPNAHALAHVSRLLEIAKILRSDRHEIIFAGFGKFLQLAEDADFAAQELPYITIEQIMDAVRSQKLNRLYCLPELEHFVQEEITLLQRINPDLVLIDNRPTARTAADYCGIKTAAVLNVHMSSYRKLPFFSLGDYFSPLQALDPIETKIECWFYDRFVMNDLNKLRQKMGLRRLFGNQHEEGDLSLLADIPEFNPVRYLPQHAHYVGPITWHNDFPEPSCLPKLDPERKTVYFSLGSASLQELITQLGSLTSENIQIVVAYGKFDESVAKTELPQHVYLEEYVNADKLLPYCDAVCCHGGNGTLYQALNFGLPVVAVATHAEQAIGAKRLQQLGLGKALHLKDIQTHGVVCLVETIKAVLVDKKMRETCLDFSATLKNWHGAANSALKIESLR